MRLLIALSLINGACPLAPTSFQVGQRADFRETLRGVRDAITTPGLWSHQPFDDAISHRPKPAIVFYHSKRWISVLAFGGLGLFLSAAPWYKSVVSSLTKGSPIGEFTGMEFISVVCKFFALILGQLYEDKEHQQLFKFQWRSIGSGLLVAMFFSSTIEGLYYEWGLPLIDAEHLPWLPLPASPLLSNALFPFFRACVDQIVSLLWLDAINLYLSTRFVHNRLHAEAMKTVRQNMLPFYKKSAAAWSLTVMVANFFSRPYINFMVINAGMVLWELLLAISSQESESPSQNKEPIVFRPIRYLLDQSWYDVYLMSMTKMVFAAFFSVALHTLLEWEWTGAAAVGVALALCIFYLSPFLHKLRSQRRLITAA